MALLYPHLRLLYALRLFLSKMRLEELAVRLDGHNRTIVSMFRLITGRNQPSMNKLIFAPTAMLSGRFF